MRKLTQENSKGVLTAGPVNLQEPIKEEVKPDVFTLDWNKSELQDNDDLRECMSDGGFNITANFKKNGARSYWRNLYFSLTDISCGICEINGIAEFDWNQNNSDEHHKSLVKSFIQDVVELTKEYGNFAFIVFSNNDTTPLVNSILDELAITRTNWERNPNSGSQIRIWIL